MCLYLLFVQLLFALSGSDRKFKPGLDRCAPVLRGSNKFASECVNVQGVWRERGQLFWNCPDGNGTEPKEDADRTVNSYTHTHAHSHSLLKMLPNVTKRTS